MASDFFMGAVDEKMGAVDDTHAHDKVVDTASSWAYWAYWAHNFEEKYFSGEPIIDTPYPS